MLLGFQVTDPRVRIQLRSWVFTTDDGHNEAETGLVIPSRCTKLKITRTVTRIGTGIQPGGRFGDLDRHLQLLSTYILV